MQRALTNSEHDRKIMAERLEALKAAQQDAKNRYNVQQDRMQQMKNEQADSEVLACLLTLCLPLRLAGRESVKKKKHMPEAFVVRSE